MMSMDSDSDSDDGCFQVAAETDITNSVVAEPEDATEGRARSARMEAVPCDLMLVSALTFLSFKDKGTLIPLVEYMLDDARHAFLTKPLFQYSWVPPSVLASEYALDSFLHSEMRSVRSPVCVAEPLCDKMPFSPGATYLGTLALQLTPQQTALAYVFFRDESAEFILLVTDVELYDVEAHRWEATESFLSERLLCGWTSPEEHHHTLAAVREILSTTAVESRVYWNDDESRTLDSPLELRLDGWIPWMRLRPLLPSEIDAALDGLHSLARLGWLSDSCIEPTMCSSSTHQVYNNMLSTAVLNCVNDGKPVTLTTILRSDQLCCKEHRDPVLNVEVAASTLLNADAPQAVVEFGSIAALLLYRNEQLPPGLLSPSSPEPPQENAHQRPEIVRLLTRDALAQWMSEWHKHMWHHSSRDAMRLESKRPLLAEDGSCVFATYTSVFSAIATLIFENRTIDDTAVKVRLNDASLHVVEVRSDDAETSNFWYAPERMGMCSPIPLAKAVCLLQHANAVLLYTQVTSDVPVRCGMDNVHLLKARARISRLS